MIAKTIKTLIAESMNTSVVDLSLLHVSMNSYIYKVKTTDHPLLKVKYYHEKENDLHDSLRTEFEALSFLWKQGIKNINKPLLILPQHRLAIFEYINGIPVTQKSVQKGDVDSMVHFLNQLFTLSKKNITASFSPAKDACFSMREYFDSCDEKLRRIKNSKKTNGYYYLIDHYLSNELEPLFAKIKKITIDEFKKYGYTIDHPIPSKHKVLSPSDFGFYNCLRSKNELYFIDFEYFGWDDPAKLVIDSLIRPRGNIPFHLQKYFFEKSLSFFIDDSTFLLRVRMLYFILTCKWCMILLNRWVRDTEYQPQQLYLNQLRKSRMLLTRVNKILEKGKLPIFLYEQTKS